MGPLARLLLWTIKHCPSLAGSTITIELPDPNEGALSDDFDPISDAWVAYLNDPDAIEAARSYYEVAFHSESYDPN